MIQLEASAQSRPTATKPGPLHEDDVAVELRPYGGPPRFVRMELVELAVEPLVDDVVGRRDADCGDEAEHDGLCDRRCVHAAQQVRQHDAGNDENMLGAVIEPGNRQIRSRRSRRLSQITDRLVHERFPRITRVDLGSVICSVDVGWPATRTLVSSSTPTYAILLIRTLFS